MRLTSLLPLRARVDPAPAASAVEAGDPERLRIADGAEIGDLLDQLIARHVPLTLATPDGVNYTTHLVSSDHSARRIGFAASNRDMRLRSLVDTDEALAVAYLDQVRLQFDLGGLMLVHGAKDSVLQAEWPVRMYRFQRRDSYRVRPLDHQKPVAHLIHPTDALDALSLRVVDLSLGGLALQLPPDVEAIQPGARLDPVEVDLDALTRLNVALRVVHVSVLDGGGNGTRLGCEWLRMSGEGARVLQRYIDLTQKRQRLLMASSRST
jgi:c-di-GMP-binding flagellar brake protein YcgR